MPACECPAERPPVGKARGRIFHPAAALVGVLTRYSSAQLSSRRLGRQQACSFELLWFGRRDEARLRTQEKERDEVEGGPNSDGCRCRRAYLRGAASAGAAVWVVASWNPPWCHVLHATFEPALSSHRARGGIPFY